MRAAASPSRPSPPSPRAARRRPDATVEVGREAFAVELAGTANEQKEGLAGREEIPAGTGMLFIFGERAEHQMWVAGMQVPIDVAWIDGDRVIGVATLDPCALKPDAVREREAAGEPFFPLELAALVHEESSHLARLLRDEALREGTSVVIDSVLSNPGAAVALGSQLAAAGYEVEVVDVEVPTSSRRPASPSAGASRTRAPSSRGRGSEAAGCPACTPATSSTDPADAHDPKNRPQHSRRHARPCCATDASGLPTTAYPCR
ncbi:DUF192 domain-containing protein [Cellulosimicrobium funkei]|uniref:DUF192 domain-containing protein n=1 Tax=Cellulosimicrobium funkei TaxID=264251 RepID=UPI00341C095E